MTPDHRLRTTTTVDPQPHDSPPSGHDHHDGAPVLPDRAQRRLRRAPWVLQECRPPWTTTVRRALRCVQQRLLERDTVVRADPHRHPCHGHLSVLRRAAARSTWLSFTFGDGPTGSPARAVGRDAADELFGGLVGAGADKTFVVRRPQTACRAQVATVAAELPGPVQLKAVYAGGGCGCPSRPSSRGITFRGNFQRRPPSRGRRPAPAPYEGIFLTGTTARVRDPVQPLPRVWVHGQGVTAV